MQITEVKRLLHTQRVRPETEGYGLTLTEDWLCFTDNPAAEYTTYDPAFFVGDVNFPAIGSPAAYNTAFRFRTFSSMEFHHAANAFLFKGMEWSTRQRDEASQFDQNRFDDLTRADKSWSFDVVKQPVYRSRVADPTALTGSPLNDGQFSADERPTSTTLGEPFIGLTRNRYIPVCNYVRNELVVPAAIVTEPLVGIVNSAPFTLDGLTIPAYTALIKDIRVSSEKTSLQAANVQVKFRTTSYQIAIDPQGWDAEWMQQGYYEVVPATVVNTIPIPEHIRLIRRNDGYDRDGKLKPPRVAQSPQFLDINGYAIDSDPATNPNWYNDVHTRVFRHLEYKDFNTIFAAPFV